MRATTAKNSARNTQGNTLVICIGLVVALLTVGIFALQFTRILGSEQEQRTAIEAAALAAAGDLSRLVIDDPYFGYISLSDFPANGTGTTAGDNYSLPVQSINSVLATNRLMNIIADWLNDPVLQKYASRDYDYALAAQARLLDACRDAIQPGSFAKDYNGKSFSIYDDALAAYKKNDIRMNGGKSTILANSLQLTLGYLENGLTNQRIPKPTGTYCKVDESQQQNGFYKAFMNIPYKQKNYVFAATENETLIVDFRKFKANSGSLPYQAPSIIKCEADQQFQSVNGNGELANNIVHAAACAQPSCMIDQREHSGALVFDFPNGLLPEIGRPGDLLVNTQVTRSPTDRLRSPISGDFPPTALSKIRLYSFEDTDHPPFGDVVRVAIYDWLRRSGPRTNVDQVVQMFNTAFDATAGKAPQSHIFQVDPTGNIIDKVQTMTPNITDCVSHKQIYAVSGLAIHSSAGGVFDIYLKDFCYQPGRQQGGIHAGEPLPLADTNITPAVGSNPPDLLGQSSLMKRGFPTGSGIRPSYEDVSVAVNIECRSR